MGNCLIKRSSVNIKSFSLLRSSTSTSTYTLTKNYNFVIAITLGQNGGGDQTGYCYVTTSGVVTLVQNYCVSASDHVSRLGIYVLKRPKSGTSINFANSADYGQKVSTHIIGG